MISQNTKQTKKVLIFFQFLFFCQSIFVNFFFFQVHPLCVIKIYVSTVDAFKLHYWTVMHFIIMQHRNYYRSNRSFRLKPPGILYFLFSIIYGFIIMSLFLSHFLSPPPSPSISTLPPHTLSLLLYPQPITYPHDFIFFKCRKLKFHQQSVFYAKKFKLYGKNTKLIKI